MDNSVNMKGCDSHHEQCHGWILWAFFSKNQVASRLGGSTSLLRRTVGNGPVCPVTPQEHWPPKAGTLLFLRCFLELWTPRMLL